MRYIVSAEVTQDVYEKLVAITKDKEMTISGLIRYILKNWVKNPTI